MYFKKLLSMIALTSVVTSGAVLTTVTNISNVGNKQSVNEHDSFAEMLGTRGSICSLTSDQEGTVYAGNTRGIIYASKNNDIFNEIFRVQSGNAIKIMVTSDAGNVYAAVKSGDNTTQIYMKANNSNTFKLFKTFNINVLSMIVYTNPGEECLYFGTDKDVQAFYPEWGILQEIAGTTGRITSIVKESINDQCIYAGNADGVIFKTLGGDQAFEEDINVEYGINNLTIDNSDNVYATDLLGQVWKKAKGDWFKEINSVLIDSIQSLITDNNNDVYVGDQFGNVWKSDGESDFTELKGTSGDITKLIYNAETNRIYAGSTYGVYSSN